MATAAFQVHEHVVPASHIRGYPHATVDDQEAVLQLAVKQYTPKTAFSAKHAVTIIGAHANGFPKELYEPLWDELYERLKSKSIRIHSIWIADVAHQGASGVLNETKLGNDPSWLDHPRDLFLVINHFRQHMKRPIIGIGHSMGGNNLVNLSLFHPRLFTSLILIDPVIQRFPSLRGNMQPARASANRRDRWPSRQAAEVAFKRSKFYQRWDPRVLDLWLKYGLRELPTHLYPFATAASSTPPTITADPGIATVSPEPLTEKELTLTTTKHQEVLSFYRLNAPTAEFPDPAVKSNPLTHPDVIFEAPPVTPFYRPEPIETFYRLPHLRPSVFYIFGEESDLSVPLAKAEKMATTGTSYGGSGGVKAGRVKEVTLPKVGHLIPMEAVGATADACAEWLEVEITSWQALEDADRAVWTMVPMHKRSQMTEEYMKAMNSLPAPAPQSTKKSKL